MTPTKVEWYSKEEAGVRLGSTERPLSPRRVLELAKEGRLQSERVKDPKTNQITVRIRAGSVERFLDEKKDGLQKPLIISDKNANGMPAREVREPQTSHALADLVRELCERCAPAEPAHLWLTLQEAAEYSGLPSATLLEFIAARRLPVLDVGRGRRGGRWRIRKVDLREMGPFPLETLHKIPAHADQL
jgi:excisionase family DNA binding protein